MEENLVITGPQLPLDLERIKGQETRGVFGELNAKLHNIIAHSDYSGITPDVRSFIDAVAAYINNVSQAQCGMLDFAERKDGRPYRYHFDGHNRAIASITIADIEDLLKIDPKTNTKKLKLYPLVCSITDDEVAKYKDGMYVRLESPQTAGRNCVSFPIREVELIVRENLPPKYYLYMEPPYGERSIIGEEIRREEHRPIMEYIYYTLGNILKDNFRLSMLYSDGDTNDKTQVIKRLSPFLIKYIKRNLETISPELTTGFKEALTILRTQRRKLFPILLCAAIYDQRENIPEELGAILKQNGVDLMAGQDKFKEQMRDLIIYPRKNHKVGILLMRFFGARNVGHEEVEEGGFHFIGAGVEDDILQSAAELKGDIRFLLIKKGLQLIREGGNTVSVPSLLPGQFITSVLTE